MDSSTHKRWLVRFMELRAKFFLRIHASKASDMLVRTLRSRAFSVLVRFLLAHLWLQRRTMELIDDKVLDLLEGCLERSLGFYSRREGNMRSPERALVAEAFRLRQWTSRREPKVPPSFRVVPGGIEETTMKQPCEKPRGVRICEDGIIEKHEKPLIHPLNNLQEPIYIYIYMVTWLPNLNS